MKNLPQLLLKLVQVGISQINNFLANHAVQRDVKLFVGKDNFVSFVCYTNGKRLLLLACHIIVVTFFNYIFVQFISSLFCSMLVAFLPNLANYFNFNFDQLSKIFCYKFCYFCYKAIFIYLGRVKINNCVYYFIYNRKSCQKVFTLMRHKVFLNTFLF